MSKNDENKRPAPQPAILESIKEDEFDPLSISMQSSSSSGVGKLELPRDLTPEEQMAAEITQAYEEFAKDTLGRTATDKDAQKLFDKVWKIIEPKASHMPVGVRDTEGERKFKDAKNRVQFLQAVNKNTEAKLGVGYRALASLAELINKVPGCKGVAESIKVYISTKNLKQASAREQAVAAAMKIGKSVKVESQLTVAPDTQKINPIFHAAKLNTTDVKRTRSYQKPQGGGGRGH